MELANVKVGMLVKVRRNTVGHSYSIGKEYIVHSLSGTYIYLSEIKKDVRGTSYANAQDLEPAYTTRAELANYLKENVLPGEVSHLAVQEKKVKELESEIARYEKYPTREEELADLLCGALATKGDKAAVLEFIKTSGILTFRPDEL